MVQVETELYLEHHCSTRIYYIITVSKSHLQTFLTRTLIDILPLDSGWKKFGSSIHTLRVPYKTLNWRDCSRAEVFLIVSLCPRIVTVQIGYHFGDRLLNGAAFHVLNTWCLSAAGLPLGFFQPRPACSWIALCHETHLDYRLYCWSACTTLVD